MTTHWTCIGNPPHTPPCGAGGTYQQANGGGAAERHTRDTGHGTTTSLHPFSRALLDALAGRGAA